MITIIKEPTYKINYSEVLDDNGKPVIDEYGHKKVIADYSEFPPIKRKCPCCGTEYEFKLPELIASGDISQIGVNGLGIGFDCHYCSMPIVVCANSRYDYEDPPTDDTTAPE